MAEAVEAATVVVDGVIENAPLKCAISAIAIEIKTISQSLGEEKLLAYTLR